jgi:hypothetical protein
LNETVAWKSNLEYAKKHGTETVLEEWKRRGYGLPISIEEIEVKLVEVKKTEDMLCIRKKIANRVLLIVSTVLLLLGV